MTSIEVVLEDTDGTHPKVPVPLDDEHIPTTCLALLIADVDGELSIRHYDLQRLPIDGGWVYTSSHDEAWEHQPVREHQDHCTSHTSEVLAQLLTAPDWP
jgi:hypothetical protein